MALTNHIKASCVSEEVHVLKGDFHIIVSKDTMRPIQKSKKSGFRVQRFYHIEKAHDDIMSACSLTTGQNASDL